MRRAVYILACVAFSRAAAAQMAPQTWDADQDGANFICSDVQYFQANNLAGVGTRCVRTDASGKLIPASFDCADASTLPNAQFQDATLGLLPQERLIGTGFTNGSICAVDDPGNGRTNVDICAVTPIDSGSGTKLVTRVISNGVGQLSSASTIGLAGDMTESGGNLTQADYPLVSRATNAPANAVNLGALASGVNEQTTAAGVATPLTYQTVPGDVQIGAASGGGLAQSSNVTEGQDAQFHITTMNDTTPGTIPAWDSRFGIISAQSGPTGPGLGVSYTSGSSAVNIWSVAPNVSWWNLGIHANTITLTSQSSGKNGLVQDVNGNLSDAQLTSNGLIKTTGGTGLHAIATAGVDYQTPLSFSGGTVNTGGAVTLANSPTCSTLQAVSGSTTSGLTCNSISGVAANGIAYFNAIGQLDEDAANFGWVDGTRIINIGTTSAPSAPGAGILDCWADSTGLDLTCKNTSGVITHGAQTQTCSGHQFQTALSAQGAATCTQPAFSDLTGSIACGQFPTPGTCTPVVVNGGSGSYVTSVSVDHNGQVSNVGTTTTPIDTTLQWSIRASGMSLTDNGTALELPTGGNTVVELLTAANVATTLAANYGSTSLSPPTWPLRVAYGSLHCSIDVGSVTISGAGSATIVFDVYYVTGNPATPANWVLAGTTNVTLSNGGSTFQTIGFIAGGSPLIPVTASLTPVIFRSDNVGGNTVTNMLAQFLCTVSQ